LAEVAVPCWRSSRSTQRGREGDQSTARGRPRGHAPAARPAPMVVDKGSSGLPLDIRHRFRNRFVGAFAVTTLVVASMAWFPAAVMAVTCPDNGNLTEPSVSPTTGTTATTFTFTV